MPSGYGTRQKSRGGIWPVFAANGGRLPADGSYFPAPGLEFLIHCGDVETEAFAKSMTRRALFIVNGDCRQGAAELRPVREKLREGDIEVLEAPLSDGEDVGSMIQRHRERVDCVVLGGGDGTLHRAAPALMASGLPLGILPMGTANDLARTLQLPLDPVQAAGLIVAGRVRNVDVGRANGVPFFNVAHIGLGARVRKNLSPELKRNWGSWSYLRTLARTFAERRSFRVSIQVDGRRERFRSIQLAVGNGRYYGGGMTIAEDAGIEDGQLHVYSVSPLNFWRLLKVTLPLSRGIVKDPEAVRMLRARQLRIETDRRMSVVADGELVTSTPVEFEVVPAAIPVYTPLQHESA